MNKKEIFNRRYINIVLSDEASKNMGIAGSAFMFAYDTFNVETKQWGGKDFMLVYNQETGENMLMVDASQVVLINYNYFLSDFAANQCT